MPLPRGRIARGLPLRASPHDAHAPGRHGPADGGGRLSPQGHPDPLCRNALCSRAMAMVKQQSPGRAVDNIPRNAVRASARSRRNSGSCGQSVSMSATSGACRALCWVYLLIAPRMIPLVLSYQRVPTASRVEKPWPGGEKRYTGRQRIRGMVRRLGRFSSRVHHRGVLSARGCLIGQRLVVCAYICG